MWFKNLRLYRLTKPFEFQPEALEEKLKEHAFKPCGSQDLVKIGWVKPLKHHGKQLIHVCNGNIMLCAKKQEKVLPASVINEQLEEKILSIQSDEGRNVGRSERTNLKEEIVMSLLPKALVRSRLHYAYIAPQENLIVFNSSSSKQCEEMLSMLRDSLGSLPVVPFSTKKPPSPTMTHWLKNSKAPKGIYFGEECELEAPKDEGRLIRCKKQDLGAEEILNHLETDMVVRKLALSWDEKVDFVLDHEFNIRRLKFSDELLEKANERDAESFAEEFDADFSLMSSELKNLISGLEKAFGGVVETPQDGGL